MIAVFVMLGHDVKEERLDVVVEGLGSQEKFREQTQVLAVDWVLPSIHLEEGEVSIPVDFIARRVLCGAFELSTVSLQAQHDLLRWTYFMPPCHVIGAHVLETKFANVQNSVAAIFLRVRCSMPSINFVFPEIDTLDLARRT